MWVLKSDEEIKKARGQERPVNVFLWLSRWIGATAGIYHATAELYGCTKCGNTTEDVYRGGDGIIKCPTCHGNAYTLIELTWVDP